MKTKPEIKQANYPSFKTYLGGKIREFNDYRLAFEPAERSGSTGYLFAESGGVLKVPDEKSTFTYAGPILEALGHGQIDKNEIPGRALPLRVIEARENEIAAAELVFFWIDSFDCYGSLVEIGIARALGKVILVALDNKIFEEKIIECDKHFTGPTWGQYKYQLLGHEMWFAVHCATVAGIYPDPVTALKKMVPKVASAKIQSGYWRE